MMYFIEVPIKYRTAPPVNRTAVVKSPDGTARYLM
jgi:hypothetical protein